MRRHGDAYMQALRQPTGMVRYKLTGGCGYSFHYEYLPEGDTAAPGTFSIDRRYPDAVQDLVNSLRDPRGMYAEKASSEIARLGFPETGEARWF